jgi:hypothetical protein
MLICQTTEFDSSCAHAITKPSAAKFHDECVGAHQCQQVGHGITVQHLVQQPWGMGATGTGRTGGRTQAVW